MYHFFVRRRVQTIFEHLNRGDFEFVLDQFADDAEHWFSGAHALGGVRRTQALRRAWYARLAKVLPRLEFDVSQIQASGPPWNTRVAVEWTDRVFDSVGKELAPNQGVFLLTIRWGRAVRFRVYCDTAALQQNLLVIAEQGVTEAASLPISEPLPA